MTRKEAEPLKQSLMSAENKEEKKDEKQTTIKVSGGSEQAQKLVFQAERKLSACCGRSPIQALELYEQAASQYRLDEAWDEQAKCLVRAAEIYEINKPASRTPLDCGKYYEDAAKAHLMTDAKRALKTYENAITVYKNNSSVTALARVYKAMADIYDGDLEEKLTSATYLEKAADAHFAADQAQNGNAMMLKVAQILASKQQFLRAGEIFEKLAKKGLEPTAKSDKYTVDDNLFKAALCQFVEGARKGDLDPLQKALFKYKGWGEFDRSEQAKLLDDTIAAFEKSQKDVFLRILSKWDQRKNMNEWTAALFLIIRKVMDGTDGSQLDSINIGISEPDLQSGGSTSSHQQESKRQEVDLQGATASGTATASS